MGATRVHLRGLALIVIVLATMAMHAGLSGACHVSGSGARTVTMVSAADMGSHSAPTAPADSGHALAQLCQATLPSATALTGAPAAIGELTPVPAARLLPGLLSAALRPWWPQPPEPSSLCIWRI